jgi:hypothetical protein
MMKERGVPEPRCLAFQLRIDDHCEAQKNAEKNS